MRPWHILALLVREIPLQALHVLESAPHVPLVYDPPAYITVLLVEALDEAVVLGEVAQRY
eukprot:2881187-Pyramimonas_sp.AAC.1